MFLVGFVFVALNAPLLWELSQFSGYVDGAALIKSYGDRLSGLVSSQASAAVYLAGILVCLVAGFLVNIPSQFVAVVCGRIATAAARLPGLRKLVPDGAFFSGANYFDKDHAALRLWLLANPAAKLQWEWELFNFMLYWGLSTNLLGAAVLTLLLTGKLSLIIVVLASASCAYSQLRSRIMIQYQNECVRAMRLAAASKRHGAG